MVVAPTLSFSWAMKDAALEILMFTSASRFRIAGDGGGKVGEVVHLKGMTVDGDGWQGVGA